MRRFTIPALLLVLFSSFLFQLPVRSQILYKVNFHDKNNANYEGLLVYFNESRSYIRVSYYTADNRYHVVNVDYKSSTGSYQDGSSYFFMSGSNPKFITDVSKDQTYNPDHFIWRKSKGQQAWNLPSTTDDPQLNIANEIPVDSFYQLSPNLVSETFLRRYFW